MNALVTQSCPTLCDPMDSVAHQAPMSLEFSKQEYWSGLPFPSPINYIYIYIYIYTHIHIYSIVNFLTLIIALTHIREPLCFRVYTCKYLGVEALHIPQNGCKRWEEGGRDRREGRRERFRENGKAIKQIFLNDWPVLILTVLTFGCMPRWLKW